jgi:hypothetical protein
MTTTEIEQVPIDVGADLSRATEAVALARADKKTAITAHLRLLTIETLAAQVAAVEATIAEERGQWADWVQYAVDHSREVADEAGWCPVYDDVMERLGLPPREKPEVDVSWHCEVTMSAEVDDDDVESMFRRSNHGASNVSVTSSAQVSFDVTVYGSMTAREGDCVCDSVDTEDIEANLPDWASDYEITDEGTVYCDHD